jgi:hypothetical protein
MKITRPFHVLNLACALFVFAALTVGCGGTPKTPPDEMCSMNPIAASCGHGSVESSQGALTGAYTVGPVQGTWGSPYRCPLQSIFTPAWQFAGVPDTIASTPAKTQFDLRSSSFTSVGNVTMSSAQFFLVEAMDGPYHVLYNDSSFVGYINDAAHPTGTSLQVSVPPYGIWIYAAHERSDYPQGVEVITFDSIAGGAGRADGVCGGRQQFVEAL